MVIVVIGATGRTGTRVVHQAADRGHRVWAMARTAPETTDGDGRVRWRRGSLVSVPDVTALLESALAEADDGPDGVGVIVTVGRGADREETTLYSDGARVLAARMLHLGLRRLAVISAGPVGDRRPHPWPQRLLVLPVLHAVFGASYRDMARMEAELGRHPDLQWSSLRPPYLRDAPPRGHYRVDGSRPPSGGASMATGDLADALLDTVERPLGLGVAWVCG